MPEEPQAPDNDNQGLAGPLATDLAYENLFALLNGNDSQDFTLTISLEDGRWTVVTDDRSPGCSTTRGTGLTCADALLNQTSTEPWPEPDEAQGFSPDEIPF